MSTNAKSMIVNECDVGDIVYKSQEDDKGTKYYWKNKLVELWPPKKIGSKNLWYIGDLWQTVFDWYISVVLKQQYNEKYEQR